MMKIFLMVLLLFFVIMLGGCLFSRFKLALLHWCKLVSAALPESWGVKGR